MFAHFNLRFFIFFFYFVLLGPITLMSFCLLNFAIAAYRYHRSLLFLTWSARFISSPLSSTQSPAKVTKHLYVISEMKSINYIVIFCIFRV